jgi:glyoxylase-like metal-dependent hydrolase (beta-lactamase superfamily II)
MKKAMPKQVASGVYQLGLGAVNVFFIEDDAGGVLFTGDAATNLLRLGVGPIYEDIDEGMRSLSRLAELQFETALFAHGRPLAPPHQSSRGTSRRCTKPAVWLLSAG